MDKSIYKNFKRTFSRLSHKKIVLYGFNQTAKTILEFNKDFNIIGICSEEKLNYEGINILNIQKVIDEKAIVIITAREATAKIIFAELFYLKKNLDIYFLDGSNEISKKNKVNISKYKIELIKLKKKIKNYDIISFDLYETLVHRTCSKPRDIFFILDNYVKKKLKINTDFFTKRIKTAMELDKQYPNISNLNQIYDQISKNYKIKKKITDKIKNYEKKLEFTFAKENSSINAILNYASKLNKKILITTDFHIEEKFLKKILKKCNIINYNNLLISCDLKKSKEHGSLFKYIKNKYPNKKILHIGDNPWSDIIQSKKNSIDNFKILKPSDVVLESSLSNLFVYNNNVFDKLSHGLIQNKLYKIITRNKKITKNKILVNCPESFGYIFFGGLTMKYLFWIFNNTKKEKISNLFFCSREGYALLDFFKYFFGKKAKNYNLVYLKTSRFLSYNINLQKNVDIINTFKKHRYYGKFKFLLKNRFDIEISKSDKNQDKIINTEQDINFLKKIIKPYSKKILKQSFERKVNYLKYFEKQVKKNSKIGLIDLTTNASVQTTLSKITDYDFYGFYLPTGKLKNKKYIKFKKIENFEKYFYLFESLMTAPHGSFLYAKKNGLFIKDKISTNQKKYKTKTKIHLGVKNFIKDFLISFKDLDILNDNGLLDDFIFTQIKNSLFEFSNEIKNSFYFDNKYVRKDVNKIIL